MFAANLSPSVVVLSVPSLPEEKLAFALEVERRGRMKHLLEGRPAAEVQHVLAEVARHAAMRAAAHRAIHAIKDEKARVKRAWLIQRCLLEECLDEVDPGWEGRRCESDGRDRVPARELVEVARGLLQKLETAPASAEEFAARERAWDALQCMVGFENERAALEERKRALSEVVEARRAALREIRAALRLDQPREAVELARAA